MNSISSFLKEIFGNQGLSGRLSRESLGVFGIQLADLFMKFILGVLLARILGPSDFGQYSYILAIILIIAIPIELGLPNLLVRYIPVYMTRNLFGKLKGILLFANVCVLLVASLLMILGYNLYGLLGIDGEESLLFQIGLLLLPFIGLNSIRMASLRGLKHTVLGMSPDRVLKNLSFILLLIIIPWVFTDTVISVRQALIYNLISVILSFMVGSFFLYRKKPGELNTVPFEFEAVEWLKTSIPFFVTGGMVVLNSKVDVALLGYMTDNNEVGLYEIAVRMASLMTFIYSAINYLIAPYISDMFIDKDLRRLQKLLKYTVIISSFFSLSLLIIYIIGGEYILKALFGEEYSLAYGLLILLGVGQLINVLSGSGAPLLNMTGKENIVAYSVSLSTIVNVILNIILIPRYGAMGAAYATIVTYTIWNLIIIVYSYKMMQLKTSIIQFVFK